MKIYEIPHHFRAFFDDAPIDEDTGEYLVDIQALEMLSDDARDKIANTARYLREKEHELVAMKETVDAINARIKTKKKEIDWLKKYTINALLALGEKVEMPDIRVSTRKSEAIIVQDVNALPERFTSVKTEISADKKALKEAIKSGEEIEGVELVTNHSLSIK